MTVTFCRTPALDEKRPAPRRSGPFIWIKPGRFYHLLVVRGQHGRRTPGSCVDTIARLRTTHPDLPVLVLMHADDETVFAALRAGARGYLIKGADGAELARAIESVVSGEAVYGAAPVAEPPARGEGAHDRLVDCPLDGIQGYGLATPGAQNVAGLQGHRRRGDPFASVIASRSSSTDGAGTIRPS